MSDQTPVDGLPKTWRKQAGTLREYGGETPAVAMESSAAQLEEALHDNDEATLTLTGATGENGCSADHLGRLVRQGKIATNAGRPGAPRIARRHLLRKTGAAAPRLASYPARRELPTAQIVQSIIDRGG